jgi:hypothetical protein
MQSGFVKGEGVGGVNGAARVHAVEIDTPMRRLGGASYLTVCTSAQAVRLPYRGFDPLSDSACPECRGLAILSA